ncbi:ecto-ADP-ribosyltransferase 5-like isoform X2 [Pseudophryne corroboree]|uniref:ecto-ADP-ribosyltransferase 5-like isoform X2 n=1 Tax=Pseudophryne corroboree TaxID=495146 RepID=UPI003081BFCC
MMLKSLELFSALYILLSVQLRCQAVDMSMMPDAFDDQYLGCAREMERVMPGILEREKKYKPFATMWISAEQDWKKIKPYNIVPAEFKDEYGTAIILYTKESPFPIYQMLNRNVSIAGRSRDHYMDRFHFKALHFYLTRTLQVLSSGCAGRSQVYRGTWLTYSTVSPNLRFGHFASSSFSPQVAQRFGTKTLFTIFTCFGVSIEVFSDFKEQEVLIPVTEKFDIMKKSENSYVLRSTGHHCSYYNCAYLGGEKKKTPYLQLCSGNEL